MHQEETPTSQLGWHPGDPPSYMPPISNFIKKRGKIYTKREGLGSNPRKQRTTK